MKEFEERAALNVERFRPTIDATSHSERAYRFILGKLLDRTFVARQSIDIDALVGELFMSRQPIRDALNRLAAEGLVVIVPQVGCVVGSPTERDTQDAINLLRSCEIKVAALAAVRRSEADLRHLTATYRQIEHLLERRDLSALELADRYRGLNRAFHHTILDAVESPSLAGFTQSLQHRVEFMILARFMRLCPSTEADSLGAQCAELETLIESFRERNREHFAVIAALRAKDAPAAQAAIREHWLVGIAALGC